MSIHHPKVTAVMTDLVKLLVDRPNDVTIQAVETEGDTTLRCLVSPADVGKLIGRQGKTARSLRTILHAIGKTVGERYLLDISPRLIDPLLQGNG